MNDSGNHHGRKQPRGCFRFCQMRLLSLPLGFVLVVFNVFGSRPRGLTELASYDSYDIPASLLSSTTSPLRRSSSSSSDSKDEAFVELGSIEGHPQTKFIDENYAELFDGIKSWSIRKQPKNDYDLEWNETITAKYVAKNDDQLDIYTAFGRQAVLEMEDPKGREANCLDAFYQLWEDQEPFSGEPFFQWLDYGSGRALPLWRCDREHFNRRSYYQMNSTEIEASVVNFHVVDPTIGNNRKILTLRFATDHRTVPEGDWSSVWGVDRRLYLLRVGTFPVNEDSSILLGNDYWKVGHCSVTDGTPVLHAGEIGVGENGALLWTNPQSGHYRPRLQHVQNFYHWMRDALPEIPSLRDAVEWRPLPDGMYSKTHSDVNLTEWEALFD